SRGPPGTFRAAFVVPHRSPGRRAVAAVGSVAGVNTDTAPYNAEEPPVVVTGDPVTVTDEMLTPFAAARGAPPGQVHATLAAVLTSDVQRGVLAHPDLRIDLSRTLHSAQSSEHRRPIGVGDVLAATATVTGVRSARGGRMIGFDTVLR